MRSATAMRWASAGVTVAGMIATPLARPRGGLRRVLSSVVVGGLFATTALGTRRRWGGVRTGAAAAVVAVSTAAIEQVGSRRGLPFGRYHYTPALRPQAGGVPAIVPLAWFAMAVPARETAHAALGSRSTPATRVALGAMALTAWDLFLDPQMVGEGYWRWQRRGVYRGIPLSNFAGWLATSAAVMVALEPLLPPGDPDPAMVGEYSFVGVMETVGFAAFFRDPVVAVAGGVAMLPLAALAARRLAR
jgi:putative membrane protein